MNHVRPCELEIFILQVGDPHQSRNAHPSSLSLTTNEGYRTQIQSVDGNSEIAPSGCGIIRDAQFVNNANCARKTILPFVRGFLASRIGVFGTISNCTMHFGYAVPSSICPSRFNYTPGNRAAPHFHRLEDPEVEYSNRANWCQHFHEQSLWEKIVLIFHYFSSTLVTYTK